MKPYGQDLMIEYTLTRSKRKTISISVRKDAKVYVKAPFKAPVPIIEAFISSKSAWVEKNIKTARERIESKKDFFIKDGHLLNILGRDYPVIFMKGNNYGFNGEAFYIPPNLSQSEIISCISKICKTMSKEIIVKKVDTFSEIMGVKAGSVKINSARTRWGSCSGKNNLNFTWKLLFAHEKLMDYVIIHELAHIKEHNHSDKFWKVVEEFFPGYKRARKELQILQEKILREGWSE